MLLLPGKCIQHLLSPNQWWSGNMAQCLLTWRRLQWLSQMWTSSTRRQSYFMPVSSLQFKYICAAFQRLCYSKPTLSKKKTKRQISLQWPMQPPWLSWQLKILAALSRNLLYSKTQTQTPRNLMFSHRKRYECCSAAPTTRIHTHSLSLCFFITHSEFFTRLIFTSIFIPGKWIGRVLFWKMSLFISYSLLFVHFSKKWVHS